ncbi:DUF4180 domain-containing protein [Nonomuraea sp. NPDC050022]|uniref:DUF4180 domain-containing protein n=1 Tax=unclassified Nonomuraea TaxID=2593643 RepID=UPI0033EFE567
MDIVMPETLSLIQGFRVLSCAPDGEPIKDERAATDLVGEAWGQRAEVIVIPAERLDDAFFQLRTRVAGDITQKFTTYRLLLVIAGDISRHTAASSALRDFVHETNQGDHVWFVSSLEHLDERLARRAGA